MVPPRPSLAGRTARITTKSAFFGHQHHALCLSHAREGVPRGPAQRVPQSTQPPLPGHHHRRDGARLEPSRCPQDHGLAGRTAQGTIMRLLWAPRSGDLPRCCSPTSTLSWRASADPSMGSGCWLAARFRGGLEQQAVSPGPVCGNVTRAERSGRGEDAQVDRGRPCGAGERSGADCQLRIDDENLIPDRDLLRADGELVVARRNHANDHPSLQNRVEDLFRNDLAGWSRKGVCGTPSSSVGGFVGKAMV